LWRMSHHGTRTAQLFRKSTRLSRLWLASDIDVVFVTR
jgi:hypothetical protein